MNTKYINEIENIVEKIRLINKTIRQETVSIIEPTLKTTSIDSGSYQIDKHKWKQQCINYRRELRKNPHGENKKMINVFENTKDLSDFLNKTEYKKKWNRLDSYQKRVKVKEYIDHLINTGELSIEQSKLIQIKLDVLIHSKKLKKVDYDIENACIKNIELNI